MVALHWYRKSDGFVVGAHVDGRRKLVLLLARRLHQTEAQLDLNRVLFDDTRTQLPAKKHNSLTQDKTSNED